MNRCTANARVVFARLIAALALGAGPVVGWTPRR